MQNVCYCLILNYEQILHYNTNTLFCRLRNELDRKYAPIRMQFESSQQ